MSVNIVWGKDFQTFTKPVVDNMADFMASLDGLVSAMRACDTDFLDKVMVTANHNNSISFSKIKSFHFSIEGVDLVINKLKLKDTRAERAATVRQYPVTS